MTYTVADLEKVERDLNFLITCFRDILVEAGAEEIASRLPWLSTPTYKETGDVSMQLTQAYSIAFHLLSMVEENSANQTRRRMEAEHGMAHEPGLLGNYIDGLRQQQYSVEDIARAFARVRIEPVLTAHPTEAKRATVLEHHRRLYLLLVKRENSTYSPSEQTTIRDDIKTELDRLWRTGEIYTERPDVASELRNAIYYLRNVFPEVLPLLFDRLRLTWENLGFDPKVLEHNRDFQVQFGNWIGGDRDGHPFVTADTTRETLQALRDNAISLLNEQLRSLAARLSLSEWLQPTPVSFLKLVEERVSDLGQIGRLVIQRNPDEPWRQWTGLMVTRLPLEENQHQNVYRRAEDLRKDLQVLFDSLCEAGASRLADREVKPVMRLVDTFGFHLARLDIRQNSQFHERAIDQLLDAAGIQKREFSSWSEPERMHFLDTELRLRRPFTTAGSRLGPEAEAVVSCYRVLFEHVQQHGLDGLGALIISMTRSVSDLLLVYLFAREAGLWVETENGPACPLPVVPLFETIADLQGSPEIVSGFLSHPFTRASISARQATMGTDEPIQQVMIGYSDSNKDGGILASYANLYTAQEKLALVGKKYGIRIRFFHGRGGTISRGAGPTHRFLHALPPGTLSSDLRLTEQGEVIAQKYANKITALYNLELLVAGVAAESLKKLPSAVERDPIVSILEQLSSSGFESYQDLVRADNFMTFFLQATPIDVIEASRHASRPARRSGKQSIADLRAIPWVFSWSQSRFLLSSWYGAGSALEALERDSPERYQEMVTRLKDWSPLDYLLANVSTSLLTANPDVMRLYADLVEDAGIRDHFLNRILEEYERTWYQLEKIFGRPLREKRYKLAYLLSLREQGLLVLHHQQLALIREWRSIPEKPSPESERLLKPLLMTVNAIASGLRTTG